ncbi:Spt20 family-domain-containing protein [Rhexocercosporidium sp. MPI-PUGE-AT-0058]|nr:Spt20 family-domain-containing protein [Rhexocercosporidium sp. MPI-PUGE-AT-0058]
MSNSRLPSTTKYPPNSATSNGAGSNASGVRSASAGRNRRDAPPQLLGRGQRNSSVSGMRSASLAGDSSIAHVAEPQPYVKSDSYILKKYRGCPPSLVIHLHPNHFRFDQQEGSFTYKSPMRIVIEHLRDRTIPHDLVEFFNDIPYYEGCMIVQIYDHKSIAPSQNTNRPKSGVGKTIPFSVHNYNAYLTPSPYVPYPTEFAIPGTGKSVDNEVKKASSQKDKENMPAPGLPNDARNSAPPSPKQPKISTIVLRPTALSNHADLAMKATEVQATGDGRRDSRQDMNGVPLSATVPPTPTTAVPSTPQTSMAPPAKRVKKTHAELTSSNIYAAESQITFATTAPLMLEPVSSAGQAAALLESLAHPMHSDAPPAPKTRKRTVAEMAADEAQAADQERHMLIFDERLGPNTARAQGGGNPGDAAGQAGGVSFEPRFERFKTIENLKAQHEETKRAEKLRREEAERKSRQEQERNKLRDEAEKREQEKARLVAQQQMASRQLQQQEAQRRQMTQQAAQSQAGLQGTPHLQQGNQIQTPHAHPQTNGLAANGMAAQPQRFHQQQVSQAQASSPIVRNGTPQSHSSPIVNQMGNVPMQQTTSSMGGSPPRPGSVVNQNHPQMGAPTGHPMSAQRSQQSHTGTPRMPNSTPNIQSTPLNRQMSQTPRMSQASPMQASMAAMQGVPMMNGQQMPVMNSQQAQAMQQQRMAQIMRNTNAQQQQQAVMSGMVPQQMSPQQQQQYMAQQMMRAQQQAAQQQGMPNQLAQTYAAQMTAMAQRSGGLPPNMNQNMMNNNPGMVGMQQMTMQQMQQQMQMQQMRQQAQAQAQAQAQHNPQQAAQQAAQQHMFQQQVMAAAHSLYNQQRPKVASSYANGTLPEEIDRQLRAQCQANAQQSVQRRFQAQRAQQQQQMMAQAQAQGMQQNMNGMQGGMGM